MRLAIFADIHANRQAFAACLEAARAKGAERIVCLGDIVGYGADPEWVARYGDGAGGDRARRSCAAITTTPLPPPPRP